MARYTATRDYRALHDGQWVQYAEGDLVDVDDELAEWVERDSPGTLRTVKGAPRDRAQRGSPSDRSA